MEYDVFICHASEDKEDFVRPLAERLKQHHLDVWYDEFSLNIGDSLMQKIDEGLSKSRYGIVVLSEHFFKKSWTKRELSGLTSREMIEKRDVILPIWHRVSVQDVLEFSPPLADKVAGTSSEGINSLIRNLIKKIKPDESPLIIARDYLANLGVDTPPISDEWWLDIIEYKEYLKYPDLNVGTRWIFPLPFPNDDNGVKRGHNIASTVLQLDWSFEGNEINISPTTHPNIVHEFIHRWPGLYECAKANPKVLAMYAPQLTIRGFDTGFEDVFDELLDSQNTGDKVYFTYGLHQILIAEKALCQDIIAYRHTTFGNYAEQELGKWYFSAHDVNYHRSDWKLFEGLIWLLSSDSDWLPESHRQKFIFGLCNSDTWLRLSNLPNAFTDSLISKNQDKFRLTKTVRNGLHELVEEAIDNLGLDESKEVLANKLIENGIVDGYYNYKNWREKKMKEFRKK
ncbi:MAG: hypothetical protein ACJASQ_001167 [Crocinitomicaceae bacterium]|jgi:hypothetical protein